MRGRGGEIVMDNFLIPTLSLLVITLCLFGLQMSEMLKELKYLQDLIRLYRAEIWELFSKKED